MGCCVRISTSYPFSFQANATSLILNEQIKTTVARAKALAAFMDRIITKAKKNDLSARRYVFRFIRKKEAFLKIFRDIINRYPQRNSGYVSWVRIGLRKGDAAPMAFVSFVPPDKKIEEEAEDKKSHRNGNNCQYR